MDKQITLTYDEINALLYTISDVQEVYEESQFQEIRDYAEVLSGIYRKLKDANGDFSHIFAD